MTVASIEIRKITLSALHRVKEVLFPSRQFLIGGDFCEGEEVAPQPDEEKKPPSDDRIKALKIKH
ncbi:MAG: hypothetical protein V1858_04835 [Candidatus Gottesmanbacteria bacterium]